MGLRQNKKNRSTTVTTRQKQHQQTHVSTSKLTCFMTGENIMLDITGPAMDLYANN